MNRSAKGQIPYISLNGQDYADSQFIIEFLGEKYNKDLTAHLSPADRGVARSFVKM
jgi:glutathione S-transferase